MPERIFQFGDGNFLRAFVDWIISGKLVQLLFHRYQFFGGDPSKGMILMPCELIFLNGHHL